MNLTLLQRQKKGRVGKTYLYAPTVLSEGSDLKPGTAIVALEVHEGDSPEETTLKVMEHSTWRNHTLRWYTSAEDLCTKKRHYRPDEPRPTCGCEKPLAEMPEKLREKTHFVLLSDVGV